METIDVKTVNGETVTVSVEEVANGLSNTFILSDFDEKGFAYLSALSLEAMENEQYDLYRALSEFIRNSSELSALSMDDIRTIEMKLRQASGDDR